MAIDVTKFTGTLPYASELFGVYQPLIGWRSNRIRIRLGKEQQKALESVLVQLQRDSRFRRAISADQLPKGPNASLPPKHPSWLGPTVGSQLTGAVAQFEGAHGRRPIGAEWSTLVQGLNLNELVRPLAASLSRDGRTAELLAVVDRRDHTTEQLRALAAIDIPGTDFAVVRSAKATVKSHPVSAVTMALQAGLVDYLAQHAPTVLDMLTSLPPGWAHALAWVDPLSNFDPETQDAALSPIGLIQIYRQYFFEFDTFLGPAVGHVWVSPGGSLEVYEIHTRKVLEQKTLESRTQTMTQEEKVVALEDELASKVANENTNNLAFAVGVSAGVRVGVFQAGASANLGFGTTSHTAREVAHTHARKQSEKLTNEMRREFKTTFRTSVETIDTSSRRYVLQNTTDHLVNYEFRRKMRQVGVQVQHIGTQLCWQVFVDNPGAFLGVAELVHIAKRGDLTSQIVPPEAPVLLQAQETDFVAYFPYPGEPDDDVLLFVTQNYTVAAPSPGYTVQDARFNDVQGVDPDEDQPTEISAHFEKTGDNSFNVVLETVNFEDQPALKFFMTLVWAPPDQSGVLEEYEARKDKYRQDTERAQHEEFVRAARERIKLASNVVPRPAEDLRSEERNTIFQRLIRQLLQGAGDETPHVTVELIRAIFDVDRMLYFVSESWWKPRSLWFSQLPQTQQLGTGDVLTPDDRVDWNGRDGMAKFRDNYLITEDSNPAPAGASLGWLLQLDGDGHRNAYLNSPFVKAVIPIRPGKERAAITWLERAHVEGTEGLDNQYQGPEPDLQGRTIREVLQTLASRVQSAGTDINNVLATETVFQTGFDPLEGGFRATGEPFEIFDQWIEVLPTEQIVAVEYTPPEA